MIPDKMMQMPGVNEIKQLLMKPLFTVVITAFAAIVTMQATAASGENTKDSRGLSPQTLCPVTWEKIDKTLFVDAEGHHIYVCSRQCLATVEARPAEYLQRLLARGQQAESLSTTVNNCSPDGCPLPVKVKTDVKTTKEVVADGPIISTLGLKVLMDAQAHGETEQRLFTLSTWRKIPLFSERERVALAWTEAVTLVADTRVPDDVYETLCKQFTEKERVDLTLAIVAINGWNRMNVAFRTVPGS
ncbi:MAG: hypothetical protein CV087_11900 [Candidatus Brocadia sp. WS118]|nr:MAG: hypothetical protein CV087_11900 [Candidatus Brocadia sp. WS118]